MQYFLKDNMIRLRIGHRILADGREYMALSKMIGDPEKVISVLRSRDTGAFFRLFPDLVPAEDQELAFYLEEEMANYMSKKIGLTFETEMDAGGNVCFANSPEVRDDFKISFSPMDILNYIHGALLSIAQSKEYRSFLAVDPPGLPYPKDSVVFWESVKLDQESN
ncbi:MAG TPA: hypothetical protein VLZ54_05305 [Arenibacter sp.]|nr:hypothetical protein [Arenibacter sp.]